MQSSYLPGDTRILVWVLERLSRISAEDRAPGSCARGVVMCDCGFKQRHGDESTQYDYLIPAQRIS